MLSYELENSMDQLDDAEKYERCGSTTCMLWRWKLWTPATRAKDNLHAKTLSKNQEIERSTIQISYGRMPDIDIRHVQT